MLKHWTLKHWRGETGARRRRRQSVNYHRPWSSSSAHVLITRRSGNYRRPRSSALYASSAFFIMTRHRTRKFCRCRRVLTDNWKLCHLEPAMAGLPCTYRDFPFRLPFCRFPLRRFLFRRFPLARGRIRVRVYTLATIPSRRYRRRRAYEYRQDLMYLSMVFAYSFRSRSRLFWNVCAILWWNFGLVGRLGSGLGLKPV